MKALESARRVGERACKAMAATRPSAAAVSWCALAVVHPVWAHEPAVVAQGAGLAGGLLHPFTGLDHLLVALGLGLLAGRSAHLTLSAAAAFLVGIVAGALLGGASAGLPWAESCIAASCVAVGALLILANRLTVLTLIPLAAISGVFHGHAHGVEGGIASGYLLGLVAGTLLLVAAGAASSRLLQTASQRAWLRRGLAALLLGSGTLALVAG